MGCDDRSGSRRNRINYFNPRTRMGCDNPRIGITMLYFKFQSTHPHGVRPLCWATMYLTRTFQSTHPHGVRRIDVILFDRTILISIHAPAWGATAHSSGSSGIPQIFQSTHPHGVRLDSVRDNVGNKTISIHAPAWGATSEQYSWFLTKSDFNPRTRMGCDHRTDA